MTDRVCYAYTAGFLRYLAGRGELARGRVALAGDLRPDAAHHARLRRGGPRPRLRAGELRVHPDPGGRLLGIDEGIASIMVTGSHIPDDRNGIKFNRPAGEILKADEAGIRARRAGARRSSTPPARWRAGQLPPASPEARAAYVARYLDFLPAGCLAGVGRRLRALQRRPGDAARSSRGSGPR